MEILITSKTHKGNSACVGGLILSTNRLVRLLSPGNWDQYADTNFEIGDVWEIDFQERQDKIAPHIEDIIIYSKHFMKRVENITSILLSSEIPIYRGSPFELFEGKLKWTSYGSGYISNKENLPQNSVGFWISDKQLTLDVDNRHYIYSNTFGPFISSKCRLPYVGFAEKLNTIPEGMLMRVSLARWWKPEDSVVEERCYLQLSGWYN